MMSNSVFFLVVIAVLLVSIKAACKTPFDPNTGLLTIPDGTTVIGIEDYKDCLMEAIHFPASVTLIGERAFWGTSSLQNVKFSPNSNLEKIDTQAFYYSSIPKL